MPDYESIYEEYKRVSIVSEIYWADLVYYDIFFKRFSD